VTLGSAREAGVHFASLDRAAGHTSNDQRRRKLSPQKGYAEIHRIKVRGRQRLMQQADIRPPGAGPRGDILGSGQAQVIRFALLYLAAAFARISHLICPRPPRHYVSHIS